MTGRLTLRHSTEKVDARVCIIGLSLYLGEENILDDIDWNLVGKVAGVGYGLTFAILVVLALSTWLTGIVVQRTNHTEDEEDGKKK
jgi:hypothetical protein